MGRIKDLNSSLPGETDNLVFDGLNGTRRISYADFKQKLIDDGFGSGSSEAVVLTQAEYNALPEEVKDSDTIFFISDAPFDSPNVVTLTRAEYDALSTADKMDGRFYYVTDDTEVATSLVVQTNQNNPDTVPSSAVLYNALSKTSETITQSYGAFVAHRSGNIVCYLWKGNGTNPPSANVTIGTLSASFRPNDSITFALRAQSSTGYATVGTSGEVKINLPSVTNWSGGNGAAVALN